MVDSFSTNLEHRTTVLDARQTYCIRAGNLIILYPHQKSGICMLGPLLLATLVQKRVQKVSRLAIIFGDNGTREKRERK